MADPLTQLHDIHLPPAISWWPLAPGWYIVIVGIASIILGLSYWGYRIIKRRRQRRELLKLLSEITSRYQSNPGSAEIIAELALFLRRLVITYYPQHHAAEFGETWLATLDNITGSKDYSEGVGNILLTAPYQKNAPPETAKLIALITTTTTQITKRKRRNK